MKNFITLFIFVSIVLSPPPAFSAAQECSADSVEAAEKLLLEAHRTRMISLEARLINDFSCEMKPKWLECPKPADRTTIDEVFEQLDDSAGHVHRNDDELGADEKARINLLEDSLDMAILPEPFTSDEIHDLFQTAKHTYRAIHKIQPTSELAELEARGVLVAYRIYENEKIQAKHYAKMKELVLATTVALANRDDYIPLPARFLKGRNDGTTIRGRTTVIIFHFGKILEDKNQHQEFGFSGDYTSSGSSKYFNQPQPTKKLHVINIYIPIEADPTAWLSKPGTLITGEPIADFPPLSLRFSPTPEGLAELIQVTSSLAELGQGTIYNNNSHKNYVNETHSLDSEKDFLLGVRLIHDGTDQFASGNFALNYYSTSFSAGVVFQLFKSGKPINPNLSPITDIPVDMSAQDLAQHLELAKAMRYGPVKTFKPACEDKLKTLSMADMVVLYPQWLLDVQTILDAKEEADTQSTLVAEDLLQCPK